MATNKDFVVKNGLVVGQNITVTGTITQAGMSMPASDGTAGQYLKTDGSGNLTWATVTSNFVIGDGSTTDTVNGGETLTFTGGTGIDATVTANTVTIDLNTNTDGVAEGSSNLYHTTARAISAIEGAAHLTIDGGTLYVDTSNNYVGIGDTSPSYPLDVAGAIGVNGSQVISSGGVITGAVADSALTIGGSLAGVLSNLKVQYGTAYSGTPIQGSFFFDSLNQKLKVYTGSAFVDAVPAGSGGGGGGGATDANTTFRNYSYTLTGTTSAVSGIDDNEITAGAFIIGHKYTITTAGNTDFTAIGAADSNVNTVFTATGVGTGTGVATQTLFYDTTSSTTRVVAYVNGIKQVYGSGRDFVATTGTSVAFTYNLGAGDTVDLQVYELLTNAAYYVKSEVYTQTQVNSQISTGVSAYLPLAGGTLSGGLNVSSGNVGIGTSSPNTKLHVNSSNGSTYPTLGTASGSLGLAIGELHGMYLGVDGPSGNGWVQAMREDGTGTSYNLVLQPSGGNVGIGTSSPATKLQVNFGDSAGNLVNLVGDGATAGSAIATNWNTGGSYFDIRLGGTTSAYTKLRIDSSGNVGIGTTSPDLRLDVTRSGDGDIAVFQTTGNHGVVLSAPSSTTLQIASKQGSKNLDLWANTLSFSAGSAERMRIDSSGVVRIGGQTGTLKLGNDGTYHADIEWEYNNNELAFTTNNVGNFTFNSNGTERMRIDSSGNVKIGPNAQDIQLLPASTNSGVNMVYLRGNAADEKSTITLNHYGVRSFDISAGVIGSGLFHIGNGVSDPAFVINGSSNVGIGTASPLVPLHILGASNETEALRVSSGASGTGCKITFRTPDNGDVSKYIMQNAYWTEIGVHSNEGLRIRNDSNAIKFSVSGSAGNCWISGSLSKGSGSFKIDHPLPEKNATHNLVHSFIEGPQADNLYRGKVDLIGGLATVNIDIVARMTEGTFAALNREVQCFTTNESGWTAIKGSVIGNILTIVAQADDCTDTISWMVIGERKDAHMLSEETDWTDSDGKVIIEPLKVSEEDQLAKSIAYHTSAGIE